MDGAMSDSAVAFFDGEFKPLSETTVNIQSKAIQYGLGCFEGVRAYWGEDDEKLRIFRLQEHFQRLAQSCRILNLSTDYSAGQMAEVAVELCKRNGYRCDVYLRPIVFNNSLQLSPIMTDDDNVFAMYGFALRDYLDTTKGITACISSWRRVSDNMIPARSKPTAAYLNSALARFDAKENGFDEAIFLTNDGYVSEGSAEHIFLVRDGELISPTCQDDNLEGITRRSLITLAREELGRKVTERRVSRTELYVADEVFFCGTGAEVTPVTAIDRREIAGGKPGPVTREMQDIFFKVVQGKVEKYADWCHVV
jgi:branched-chain amino acid aminotransferase